MDNFNIILYSIPIYQLIYFSIELTVSPLNEKRRIHSGLLLFLMVLTSFSLAGMKFHDSRIFNLMFWTSLCLYYPAGRLYFDTWFMGIKTQKRKRYEMFAVPFVIVFATLFFCLFYSDTAATLWQGSHIVQLGMSASVVSEFLYAVISRAVIVFLLLSIVLFTIQNTSILTNPTRNKADSKHQNHSLQDTQAYFLGLPVFIAAYFFHSWLWFGIVYNLWLLVCGGIIGKKGAAGTRNLSLNANGALSNLQPEVASVKEGSSIHLQVAPGNQSSSENYTKTQSLISKQSEKDGALKTKLLNHLQETKTYKNHKLSPEKLSKELKINKTKLTFIIHELLQSNFYKLINAYRIEESIRLLEGEEGEKYTIDSIALMAGFQSKSSFYAAFKQYTGLTPKEYKSRTLVRAR